ncbi:MAG: bifunctional precorrin-2 dehydrogenase/sirohydrochlorin ferrochelatase [Chloroflexus sp.]|jgi:precorrin-2 dehydrogenase/sirohydrochlorin ferrochelatase|nr:bifunctional precorrin-2 dehydrogenase/sirohydrochlorin ferrochelatase [Chloroflexus sp.]MBO9319192.1 bifunctional precorrin-2 dehydrogenase/sirohydrochlorin ferrochelatase [Chloroflexus sp.]
MYYPVMLDLRGKRVLFIGGGGETEVKVQRLIEAGAWVRLISPFTHPALEPIAQTTQLDWQRREYRYGDLEGFMLCFVHLPDTRLNARIAQEARERGIWLNAVDDPQYCDFILPSVHNQGDLVIAVSTSGVAPALAVRIRERLAQEYGPEYAVYLQMLRAFRTLVRQAYPHSFAERKAAWYRIVDSSALDLLRAGAYAQAQALLLQTLYASESVPVVELRTRQQETV